MGASAEPRITLEDISDNLRLVHDLLEATYMAARSLEIGRDPLARLLDVTTDKLAEIRLDLDSLREARS